MSHCWICRIHRDSTADIKDSLEKGLQQDNDEEEKATRRQTAIFGDQAPHNELDQCGFPPWFCSYPIAIITFHNCDHHICDSLIYRSIAS